MSPNLDEQKKCVRTPYASYAIAMTKVGQIRRGRARSKGTNSKREYVVTGPCEICSNPELAIEIWHVSSRNGKGAK